MNKNIVINQIPSPTWSWLKMDNSNIDFPSDFKSVLPSVEGGEKVVVSKLNGTSIEFNGKVSGVGKEIEELFASCEGISLTIPKNTVLTEPVVLNYTVHDKDYNGQTIIAEENSTSTIIILSASDKKEGIQALNTKVIAKSGAIINIQKVQLLPDGFIQVDETSSYVSENATVNLKHIVLGGAKTFVGVGTDLREYKGTFNSDMAYFCKDNQELDLNYIVYHYGKKTNCLMHVDGTLKDNAKKTYRGTIDFKIGCSGSVGEEQEETLLLSPSVINNSIPVILCDEEDVSGEHGASIGRLAEDILFYMQSRGMDKKACEDAIARAKIQRLVSFINNEKVLAEIEKTMNTLFEEH